MNKTYYGKFAVLSKIKKPLEIYNLPIPNLKKNQILVKLKYSFICGSQMNEWLGNKGRDNYLPHLLGHEGVGIVVKKGKNINKFKLNDKVIISWIKGSGSSFNSLTYNSEDNIKINSGPVSTFSTYTIVPENRLTRVPKFIKIKNASIFGCAMPTAFGLANKAKKIKLNKKKYICIFGTGGIGLLVLICLRYLGYSKIIAIDKDKRKLLFAKSIGATESLTIKEFKKLILSKKLNTDDISLNIETSGNKNLMENSFKYLSNNGTCIIAGNTKIGNLIKINPYDIIFGKKIIGSIGGDISIEKNLKIFNDIIEKNKIFKKIYFKKEYSLNQINKAILDFKDGKIIRPLIKF